MTRPNLSKDVNELLVLATLRGGAVHGYEIALAVERDSRGAFTFQHGTLYPILHRLEKQGLIKGRWTPESRRKRTYELTAKGRTHLEGETGAVRGVFVDLMRVLEGPSHATG